uniref:K-box domain-containing protein n=1 Tax=Chenopodium quinoa TaxID=63459 RepID=A0A803L704_CHEQI
MYDEYQKVEGVDLWRKHYEQMKERERKLAEVNNTLRTEISRRMGGDLEDLTIGDLRCLHQQMDQALDLIRNRKYHVIKNQTGTSKKKVKSLEEIHGNLVMDLETRFRAPGFGIADDDQGNYEAAAVYSDNGAAANLFAMSRHPRHS